MRPVPPNGSFKATVRFAMTTMRPARHLTSALGPQNRRVKCQIPKMQSTAAISSLLLVVCFSLRHTSASKWLSALLVPLSLPLVLLSWLGRSVLSGIYIVTLGHQA